MRQGSKSLYVLLPAIGLTLFGLPFYIYNIYYYIKKKQSTTQNEQNTIKKRKVVFKQIHYVIQDKQITITVLVIIALSFIFVLICYFEPLLIDSSEDNILFYELFMLAFRVLFSKLIAKTELFIHHYVALGIILIGIVLFEMLSVNLIAYVDIFYYCLFSFGYSLALPYVKLVIERKYIQPITLVFYMGVSMNVLIWLIYMIVSFIEPSYYIRDFQSLSNSIVVMFKDWTFLGLGFSFMVIESISIIGFIYIIHFDNPITEGRLFQLSYVVIFLFNTFQYTVAVVLVKVIGSICCLIGTLIFIEIVIIKVCGMNSNTKQEIIKRSNEEVVSEELLAVENVDEQIIE